MLDLNVTGECQIAATDGETMIVYDRLSTDDLRWQIDDAKRRGLIVLAVALYNCSNRYVYEWRADLQGRHWLGCKLTMTRYRGEYKNTQHAIIKPAKERRYSLADFERFFLKSAPLLGVV